MKKGPKYPLKSLEGDEGTPLKGRTLGARPIVHHALYVAVPICHCRVLFVHRVRVTVESHERAFYAQADDYSGIPFVREQGAQCIVT